ncbi:MAG: hypothetical protein RIR70_234 [Pseudomonadota bacterium]
MNTDAKARVIVRQSAPWAVSLLIHAVALLLTMRALPAATPGKPPIEVALAAPPRIVIPQPAALAAPPALSAREPGRAAVPVNKPSTPVITAPAPLPSAPSVAPAPAGPQPTEASSVSPAAPFAAAPAASTPAPVATPADAPPIDRAWLSKTLARLMNERKQYPRMARRLGMEGVVMIEAVIDEEGKLVSAQIQKGSGHELLDRNALALLASVTPVKLPQPRMGGISKVVIPVRYALE